MILGTLRTHIIEDHSHSVPEGGFFTLDVNIDEAIMQRSGDVKAYGYTTIAAWLSSAIKDTEVPKEKWTFEFSERARRRYDFPEFLDFGIAK